MSTIEWLTMLSILTEGLTFVLVLHYVRTMGAFTERIERAQEGTRRSNELKRQSDERVMARIREFEQKAEFLDDLLKASHDQRSA